MEVSIIVRFRNESPYLEAVMKALIEQTFLEGQYEIVAVDNRSADGSRRIADRYATTVLLIDYYQPGKALNRAIAQSAGRYIAVLSAHAIPANRNWLATLYKHMEEPRIGGVYGAQLYPVHSKFLDKRDLDIFSADKPRIEKEDSDFWNANSMFPRVVWEKQEFDENVFELEDHYWTKLLMPLGYEIHFEPNALVYHYGHVDRNDREYLPPSPLSDKQRIKNAIADLETSNADWPTMMIAGLTLASLTHSPHIECAVHPLGKVLRRHGDFDVRWRMAGALGKMPFETSLSYLIEALSDRSFYVRDEAAWSLARLGPMATKRLMVCCKSLCLESIPFAALALGMSGTQPAAWQAVELLVAEMKSGSKERACNAVYFAGELAGIEREGELIDTISGLMRTNDTGLVAVCCWALGNFAAKSWRLADWKRIVFFAREHSNARVRYEATVALGKLGLVIEDAHLLETLSSLLHDNNSRVRYGAIQSIRHIIEQKGRCTGAESFWDVVDDDCGVMYELELIKKIFIQCVKPGLAAQRFVRGT